MMHHAAARRRSSTRIETHERDLRRRVEHRGARSRCCTPTVPIRPALSNHEVKSERNVVVGAATATTGEAATTACIAGPRRLVTAATRPSRTITTATTEELYVRGDDLGDVALVAIL